MRTKRHESRDICIGVSFQKLIIKIAFVYKRVNDSERNIAFNIRWRTINIRRCPAAVHLAVLITHLTCANFRKSGTPDCTIGPKSIAGLAESTFDRLHRSIREHAPRTSLLRTRL